jgi:hypothetical protein
MRTSLLVVALAGSGCTVDMTEPEITSTTEQAIGTHNRLAANRLAANRLAANRLAANRLAANSLNGLVAISDTSQILDTEAGREVYSYLVSCALDPDTVIHATVAGAADTAPDANYVCVGGQCEFYGALGLAPDWLDKRLNHAGKGWISACLFARSNEYDTAAAISLRGRNPGLSVSLDETQIYSVEEGAFYGNVFIDDPDQTVPPDWHACTGEGQAAGEPTAGGLVLRDCAEENPGNPGFTYCGFKYDGHCRDFTPAFPSPYACTTSMDGTYNVCEGESNKNHDQKYRHVITTFVSP